MNLGLNEHNQVQSHVMLNRPPEIVKILYEDDTHEIYHNASLVEYGMAKIKDENKRSNDINVNLEH